MAIMAKAPNAGRVKTRLSPALSAEAARDLGCCFLRDMTANLALAAREVAIDPHVAFAPAGSEPAFAPFIAPGTRFVLADGSAPVPSGIEGLGRGLLQAVRTLLSRGYGAVGLLNADSPSLPTERLTRAVHELMRAGDRVVLGPCEDGGYYFIGMKVDHAGVFRAIDWSSAAVADQTRARARELGLELIELDPWYDVDEPAALRRLIAELGHAGVGYPAPHTSKWLNESGLAGSA
jgi:rSAM/selenodomain-associated transferase 1